jgi:lysophospholipid acyltransferase (LPLAT)-like uncharacterized protein
MARVKKWFRRHRTPVVITFAYPLVNLLMSTVRIQWFHRERLDQLPTSSILCGLHARGIMAAWIFRKRGYWVLVSLSRDGELQNRLYNKLGFRTVRGSTGRGGVKATIEAIRMLRSSKEALIVAIDGPRGPRGIVQEGAILMARKSGAALMPVGVSTNPRWTLNTWDFYMVPKFFSRCAVVVGEPIYVPESASEEELEAIRCKLEKAIHAAEAEANEAVRFQPLPNQDRDPAVPPCA